jgi:hypothetical protein
VPRRYGRPEAEPGHAKGPLVDSFMDFFWLLIWSFFFVAYLMIFFNIITDLFRDRELGGWAKAFWVIFLIFFPFLAALIYLIARGRGMGERQLEALKAQKAATDQYIQSVAGPQSPADQIASAKALLDSGAISQAEYEALKSKALA